MNKQIDRLTILGGGAAGLAVGYFARKKGIPFTLFEAGEVPGGLARTYRFGDFLFDSGAHRFHDKDPEMTAEIKTLLGDDLLRIEVPSQIYIEGNYVDFPLSPLNVFKSLGLKTCLKAAADFLKARRAPSDKPANFEEISVRRYGRLIAQMFLLNYSEKLWGIPCRRLLPQVSGKRLKGMGLWTFLLELTGGMKKKTQHLDGAFYYPKQGIGEITERLAQSCGSDTLHLGETVTKILHDGHSIRAIETNRGQTPTGEVVNTLPISLLIRLLDPAPPEPILKAAGNLRFRNIILVAFFLAKNSVTRNGSVYFPERDFDFTRVYEPKNRSASMAPEGKTSLVAEIPCWEDDALWREQPADLIQRVSAQLRTLGWFEKEEILSAEVMRLPRAYPVLQVGSEKDTRTLFDYLRQFDNLSTTGRSGKFTYAHIHDMMRFAKNLVDGYEAKQPQSTARPA